MRLGSRFISAVALYGPKPAPVRDFLAGIQALIAGHVGERFRPYSLEQIHATLIAINGIPDPDTAAIVNQYYLENAGARLEMDLHRVMQILAEHLARPLQIRIGGRGPHDADPFLSRGQRLFERAASVQGNAFVVMGWPVTALTGSGRPLDELRRAMNAANVLHRYHQSDAAIDDDFYLVVGHHTGAPASALDRAARAVREYLAASPLDVAIGASEVKIVAADSHTMAPALFVSDIPADEVALRELMS
jgi:hypothetical protein